MQARADAPAPETTTLILSSRLPVSSTALRSAAPEMMAVPCWSSCMTGICISRLSRSSMTKHSGALMSSRLMPPKVGSSAFTTVQKFDVVGVHLEVEDVDVGELLEEDALALHHRLSGVRPDVAQAEHRRAVGDHGHQVSTSGVGVAQVRVLRDLEAGLGDAWAVGEPEVARGGAGLRRDDLNLPLPAARVIRERILSPHPLVRHEGRFAGGVGVAGGVTGHGQSLSGEGWSGSGVV